MKNNHLLSIPLLATVMAASLAVSSVSFGKEGDVEACAGLELGDPCTRADGDPGLCQSDNSDPNVITCDDDPSGGSGNSGNSGSGNSGNSGSGNSGNSGSGNSGNSGSGNSGNSDDGSSDDGGGIECSMSSGVPGNPTHLLGLVALGAVLVHRRSRR